MQQSSPAAGLHPDVPLNLQIYWLMRQEIEDGFWEGRLDFPGELELAQRYGVSAVTARAALERLAKEHFIQRGRGKRTVALAPKRRMNESAAVIMPAGGEKVFSYKLLSAGVGIAPLEACDAFGVAPGSELWLCSRLRTYQHRHHSVTMNVQQPEVGRRHTAKALASRPMADSLLDLGVTFSQMKRRVSVSFPPPTVAHQLGITMQDPTLVYTFMLLNPDQLPVEWVRIYVHPDEQQHWETFDLNAPRVRANVRV